MPAGLHPGEARRWLLRLVYTRCMDLHRQRRRFVEIEEENEAGEPGLEAALLESELIAVVRERIESLPLQLRGVAELHLLQDLSYSEIADRLSLTEVNVRKRMQNVRTLLREHLHAYRSGDVRIQAPRKPIENESRQANAEPEPLRTSGWSLEALEHYVQIHPRGWKKRWELALRLREAGSLEKAVAHFRAAASRQPRRMEIWSDLGMALLALGRREEAREAFESALRRARDEGSRARLRELIARC